jgi:hypothetical protein
MKIRVKQLKCLRCGHKWMPRTDDVRTCPTCKSPYWDKPRGNPVQAEPKPVHTVYKPVSPVQITPPLKPVQPTAPAVEPEAEQPGVSPPSSGPAPVKKVILPPIPERPPTITRAVPVQPKRKATKEEQQAFDCAKNMKFSCMFREAGIEHNDYCKYCFDAPFWDKKDIFLEAMGEEEAEPEEPVPDSIEELRMKALNCDFKTWDGEQYNCHFKNTGIKKYSYCPYCWELEEIWGDKAAGYKERRKKE